MGITEHRELACLYPQMCLSRRYGHSDKAQPQYGIMNGKMSQRTKLAWILPYLLDPVQKEFLGTSSAALQQDSHLEAQHKCCVHGERRMLAAAQKAPSLPSRRHADQRWYWPRVTPQNRAAAPGHACAHPSGLLGGGWGNPRTSGAGRGCICLAEGNWGREKAFVKYQHSPDKT